MVIRQGWVITAVAYANFGRGFEGDRHSRSMEAPMTCRRSWRGWTRGRERASRRRSPVPGPPSWWGPPSGRKMGRKPVCARLWQKFLQTSIDGAGSPGCSRSEPGNSCPRIPRMSGDRVERSSKRVNEELLIAGFHRSKGSLCLPGHRGRSIPQTGSGGPTEAWRRASACRPGLRVHLIALAAGVQKEPVRAMSI